MKESNDLSNEKNKKSNSLSIRIRQLRDEKGLTQTQLAQKAELDSAVLSRLLSGEKTPRMEHVLALANALEINPIELIFGTEHENILEKWVSIEEFKKQAIEKDSIEKKYEDVLISNKSLQNENESLKNRIEQLNTDNRKLLDQAFLAEKYRIDLEDTIKRNEKLLNENTILFKERALLQANVKNLQNQVISKKNEINNLEFRIREFEKFIRDSKSEKVNVAIVSAGIAAMLVALTKKD